MVGVITIRRGLEDFHTVVNECALERTLVSFFLIHTSRVPFNSGSYNVAGSMPLSRIENQYFYRAGRDKGEHG